MDLPKKVYSEAEYTVWKVYLRDRLFHTIERYCVISSNKEDPNETCCRDLEEAKLFIQLNKTR